MAKSQILDLQLTDFLGADKNVSVSETMDKLMGISPESNMNKLDKAYELQEKDITALKQKESIISINAIHSTASEKRSI